MSKRVGRYIRKKFHKKRWRQFAFMMACIVVFCTTYALLLPAVTLEKTADCGLEEHQHEKTCYENQLVCGNKESDGHRHTDSCYRKVLVCGEEVHVHSEDCFHGRTLKGTADENISMGDTEEEAGQLLLDETEDIDQTAVNEPASGAAMNQEIDPEAEGDSLSFGAEAAAESEFVSEQSSGSEADEESASMLEQSAGAEAAGESASMSEQSAAAEAAGEANPLLEEADTADWEAETPEEQFSDGEAAGEAETESEEPLTEEAGEAETESEENAGEEAEPAETESEEPSTEEAGAAEETPSAEPGMTEEQSAEEETAGETETFPEETADVETDQGSETLSEETSEDEADPESETLSEEISDEGTESVEENPEWAAETSEEQSSAEETAVETETLSEETAPEEIPDKETGATTEQVTSDIVTEDGTAPAQEAAEQLACQGPDYEVTVTSGVKEGIPKDASLSVSEIMPEMTADNTDADNNTDTELTYEEYVSQTEEALGIEKDSGCYIRLFDIKIVDAYGEKIKIQAPVNVKIRLTDQKYADISNAQVVHFADETKEADIAEETNGTEKTDSETLSGSAAKSATTPSRNAEAAGKAKKIKKAVKAEKEKKEKKGDVIQDLTVEAGVLPEDGTTLSFETEGFSVFALVGTTIEKTVLASDGHNYRITATYGEETEIPKDADLAVEEITEVSPDYDKYVSKTEKALGMEEGSAGYIRLFDIKIVDKNNPEVNYQPAADTTVDVRIELADSESKDLSLVHFADNTKEGEKIECRTEAADNGQSVSFAADGFSVYAIVYGDDTTPETKSIQYVFHYSDKTPFLFTNKNGDSTDTQYVKDGEALFYPGVPTNDPNQEGREFWGWYEGTFNGDAFEWGEEAEFETPISVSETATVNLYARYEQTYYVTYYDEKGSVYSVVKHANGDPIRLDVAGTETPYTASNAQKAFLGWSTTSGTTDEVPENTTMTVTGNVSLYPSINDVKWINFNGGETGNGASYTAPVYVLGNVVTSDKKPEDPTRRGYAFQGWYKDAACTQEFKWDGTETITEDITLFAKWVEADTKYTVIFWKQNIEGTGYDYVESSDRDALTGSTVSLRTTGSNGDTNRAGKTVNGESYKGFHYNNAISNSSATVLANGTTVLNVYYDRYVHTFTFIDRNRPGYSYTVGTGNNATYGLVDNQYVSLVQIDGIWMYQNGTSTETTTNNYTGQRYSINNENNNSPQKYRFYNGQMQPVYYRNYWGWYTSHNGNSWSGFVGSNFTRYQQDNSGLIGVVNGKLVDLNSDGTYTEIENIPIYIPYEGENRYVRGSQTFTIHTVTALFGSDISWIWNFTGTNGVSYPQTNPATSWQPSGSSTYTARITRMEIMPDEDITFSHTTTSNPTRYFHYYVEALPGAENTRTFNGREYSLYTDLTHDFNLIFYEDDFWPLTGFERQSIATANGTNVTINTNGTGWNNSWNSHLYFYYTRNSYDLEFRNSTDTSEVYATNSVKYQAPVADSIIADPNPPDGYTFHGWYADPSCSTRVFFTEPTEADLAELKYELNSAGRKTYNANGEHSDEYIVLEKMPASNYVLYANWAPKRYQVNIDPNGGALLTDGTQATYYNIDYGEKIGEYANVTRNYIKISEGQDVTGKTRYSYHYDTRTDNDGQHRWACYNEDPNGDYIEDSTAYTFVGWYRVADNGAGAMDRAPFNFDTLIEENTTLRAMWRREGVFKVKYTNIMNEGKTGQLTSPDSKPDDDQYTYVDLAEAKVGPGIRPPVNYQFAGWRVLGTESPDYNPGDIFIIDSNFAEYEQGGTMYVTLEPVFIQIGDASITYDINVPVGSTATSTELTDVENNMQTELKDNGSIDLSSGNGFDVTGYRLIGWSDQKLNPNDHPIVLNNDGSFTGAVPANTHLFKLGGTYGVSDSNTLYAVWELRTIPVPFIKQGEKTDGTYEQLAGAEFKLYADEECSTLISSVYGAIENTDASVTSSNETGTNVTFPKVPVGTFYFKETQVSAQYKLDNTTVHTIVVSESTDGNNTLSYTVDGVYTSANPLVIKNHLKGTLAVTKTVDSIVEADAQKDFTFTATVLNDSNNTDTSVNGNFGDLDFTNGVASFTLKHTEEVKIRNLVGKKVVIKENDAAIYTTTAVASAGNYDIASKTYTIIIPDEGDTVTFTNKLEGVPVRVLKVDQEARPLEGAKFSFVGENKFGGEAADDMESTIDDSGDAVIIEDEAVPLGTYVLQEDEAPAGYIGLEGNAEISISRGTNENIEVSLKIGETQITSPTYISNENGTWVIKIMNTAGYELPSTGGPGTSLIYLLGIMLTGLAGTGLVMRKRRKAA